MVENVLNSADVTIAITQAQRRKMISKMRKEPG